MRGKNMKLSRRKIVRRLLDLDRSKCSVLNRKLKGRPPSYWEARPIGSLSALVDCYVPVQNRDGCSDLRHCATRIC